MGVGSHHVAHVVGIAALSVLVLGISSRPAKSTVDLISGTITLRGDVNMKIRSQR
jgi:hypothetical protein